MACVWSIIFVWYQMIYRDAGVAVRRVVGGAATNNSLELAAAVAGADEKLELHPENLTRLRLTTHLNPSEAVFDRWRLFKIHNFAVKAERWAELAGQPVCLATHTTLDRMHWVVQLANRWSGPVSVALFLPDVEFGIAETFLEWLRSCYPEVRYRVAFHLMYPDQFPPRTLATLRGLLVSPAPHTPPQLALCLV